MVPRKTPVMRIVLTSRSVMRTLWGSQPTRSKATEPIEPVRLRPVVIRESPIATIIIREIADNYIEARVEGHDHAETGSDRFRVLGDLIVHMVMLGDGMPAIDGIDIIDRDGERYPMSTGRDFVKHVPVITDPTILDVLEQLANGEM